MEPADNRKVIDITQKTATKNYATWQECYGDYLFMREQKIGVFSYETKIALANLVIEKGLSYQESPNAYLAVIKYLAAVYNQTNQYERVLNDLLLLVQLQEEDQVPCWVFHNYIDAELHVERTLSRVIRNPSKFLTDLARTSAETDVDVIRVRQQNILKNLFREASFFIAAHRDIVPAADALSNAAAIYGVEESLEYVIFAKTISGENPDALYKADEAYREALLSKAEDAERKNVGEQSISSDQFHALQDKLTNLEAVIAQLTSANEKLEQEKASTEKSSEEIKKQYSQLESLLISKNDGFAEERQKLIQATQEISDQLQEKERIIVAKTQLIKEISADMTKLKQTITEQESQLESLSVLPPQIMVAKAMKALTEIMYAFTKRTYPDLNNNDNWQKYVLAVFDYDKLEDDGLHRLEDMDVYHLLKLTAKNPNWSFVRDAKGFEHSDRDKFYNAIDVRNHYAHFHYADSVSTFKKDLFYISELLGVIRIPHDFRPELSDYMKNHMQKF